MLPEKQQYILADQLMKNVVKLVVSLLLISYSPTMEAEAV